MPVNITAASTKLTTVDGETQVQTGRGVYHGCIVVTDGTNNATVLVEDGTTEIAKHVLAGADLSRDDRSVAGIHFRDGLNVTVTGTGASAYVIHRGSP